MFVAETFRQRFPEFKDPDTYPIEVLDFWAGVAGGLVNADRWGQQYDYGVCLVLAHHLVIARRNAESEEAGGNVGEIKGPLTSRAVDKVTNSWDSSAASEEGAGFWNLTTYGLQYIRLARMIGAGGVQL